MDRHYLGDKKTFADYESNPMLQDTVERNIEIIGEAMSRLLKLDSKIKMANARRIVDGQNKIIHGYNDVENVQVWGIIINSLPTLKKEAKVFLKE
ncbi:hypothetical protein MNBD_BACTEROID06-1368 [hydrothermal vent metagenome]|uniref:DUF86 domain-containing protein n=1 Tax=hydrothermal vent metagenome TaxID=652676 RepID=A0A3B0UCX4_9ZZZZ